MPETSSSSKSLSVWIARHLAVAGIFGFLGVLLVGYAALFAPQLRKIRQANRLQILSQEKKAKTEYLGKLRELEANFKKIPDDDVNRVAAMIPFENDLPGIMASLEAASQKAEVTLGAIGFAAGSGGKTPMPGANLDTIQLTLQVSNASYDRFKLFIEALERHLRLFDIQGIGMSPGSASYTIKMRTYVQPASAARAIP